jgi:hypothetical protein
MSDTLILTDGLHWKAQECSSCKSINIELRKVGSLFIIVCIQCSNSGLLMNTGRDAVLQWNRKQTYLQNKASYGNSSS